METIQSQDYQDAAIAQNTSKRDSLDQLFESPSSASSTPRDDETSVSELDLSTPKHPNYDYEQNADGSSPKLPRNVVSSEALLLPARIQSTELTALEEPTVATDTDATTDDRAAEPVLQLHKNIPLLEAVGEYGGYVLYNPLDAWNREIFRYNRYGELDGRIKFDATLLHEYIYNHPLGKNLVMWVQMQPAFSEQIYLEFNSNCRARNCDSWFRTTQGLIEKGSYRVVMDEFYGQDKDHKANPWVHAAIFHIHCFERMISIVELIHQGFKIFPDLRQWITKNGINNKHRNGQRLDDLQVGPAARQWWETVKRNPDWRPTTENEKLNGVLWLAKVKTRKHRRRNVEVPGANLVTYSPQDLIARLPNRRGHGGKRMKGKSVEEMREIERETRRIIYGEFADFGEGDGECEVLEGPHEWHSANRKRTASDAWGDAAAAQLAKGPRIEVHPTCVNACHHTRPAHIADNIYIAPRARTRFEGCTSRNIRNHQRPTETSDYAPTPPTQKWMKTREYHSLASIRQKRPTDTVEDEFTAPPSKKRAIEPQQANYSHVNPYPFYSHHPIAYPPGMFPLAAPSHHPQDLPPSAVPPPLYLPPGFALVPLQALAYSPQIPSGATTVSSPMYSFLPILPQFSQQVSQTNTPAPNESFSPLTPSNILSLHQETPIATNDSVEIEQEQQQPPGDINDIEELYNQILAEPLTPNAEADFREFEESVEAMKAMKEAATEGEGEAIQLLPQNEED